MQQQKPHQCGWLLKAVGFPGFPATEKPGFFIAINIFMKHPNEGFIRKFLGTDKAYKEKLLAEEKQRRLEDYLIGKKNKQNILTEENKKSITRTIDVVYSNNKKHLLVEQKNTKDWKIVQTQYGIFYYNEKTKEWMNTFGVIKKFLGEFIQLIDYSATESDTEGTNLPKSPTDFQVSSIDSVGNVEFQFVDNSLNEVGI